MIPEPDIENPVECGDCHTPTEVATIKKFPGKGPAAMIAGGLFSSLFIFGTLAGVPFAGARHLHGHGETDNKLLPQLRVIFQGLEN